MGEDQLIKTTDLLLLAARNDVDTSHVEVYVYEERAEDEEANLYVHHDIMLAESSLCLAWIEINPKGANVHPSHIALGSLDPLIKVWDLNVMNPSEPVAILGRCDNHYDRMKSTKKFSCASAKFTNKTHNTRSHVDSVISLSWNKTYRNVLASGSADNTVKIWDLVREECVRTLVDHKGKVQAVEWNRQAASVILTGSDDRSVSVLDTRSPNVAATLWGTNTEVEGVAWHQHDPTTFIVSTEDGILTALDARKTTFSKPLFRLRAHDKATCSMSFN